MMHRCVRAMSIFWNGISIGHLVLWRSNKVNEQIIVQCFMSLLTAPLLLFLTIPSQWGPLLLHNIEISYHLLYIFSVLSWEDMFETLIYCPLIFVPIIWYFPFVRCMMRSCWIFVSIFTHVTPHIYWNIQGDFFLNSSNPN